MFLCTGNSARSQMAEGLARHLGGEALEAHSAGLTPKGLHPLAVAVMEEIGINIREQYSKGMDPALLNQMDRIITVCANADKACPATPPNIHREHWPLADPAGFSGSETERRDFFRKTRDELRQRIVLFLKQTTTPEERKS